MNNWIKGLVLVGSIGLLVACGDSDETSEQTELEKVEQQSVESLLNEYEDCLATASGKMDCKTFTAKAISSIIGVKELVDENGEYLEYHDIYEFVSNNNNWENLGDADDQDAADRAQQLANEGKAVIAINTEDEHKLVIIIIPGEQTSSSKWGVKVPNCAAFFPVNGPEPFINKTMNYAWSTPDGVEIWARK